MILVLGKAQVQPDKLDDALAISQAHVLRSRAEPGCIEHGVHRSHDAPDTLVFIERWQDKAALQQHFAVPASRQFAKALTALCVVPPVVELLEARSLPRAG